MPPGLWKASLSVQVQALISLYQQLKGLLLNATSAKNISY